MQLPIHTTLKNHVYRIDEKIGQGGFGITYKGTWFTKVSGALGSIDARLPVAIKEFFFEDYCSRDADTQSITIHSTTGKDLFMRFKEKLLKEAAILSQLSHPNIVRVLEVFEANNTAYMIMDYIEGPSLKELLKQEGRLPVTQAVEYAKQVAAALEEIHNKNILHLDIKPGNILINQRNGNAMLIDFGISKRYNTSHEETSTTPQGRSKGYAPIEQYLDKGAAAFSPALDIYALGATLYHSLTGEIPIEANERVITYLRKPSAINPAVSPELDAIVMKAMELKKELRYQQVTDFSKALTQAVEDKTEIFAPLPKAEIRPAPLLPPEPVFDPPPPPAPEEKLPISLEPDTRARKPAAKPKPKVEKPAVPVIEPKPAAGSSKKWLVAAAAVVVLAVGGWLVYTQMIEPEPETPPATVQEDQAAQNRYYDSLHLLLMLEKIKVPVNQSNVAALAAMVAQDDRPQSELPDFDSLMHTFAVPAKPKYELKPLSEVIQNGENNQAAKPDAKPVSTDAVRKRRSDSILNSLLIDKPDKDETIYESLSLKNGTDWAAKLVGAHEFGSIGMLASGDLQITKTSRTNVFKVNGKQTGYGIFAGDYCIMNGSIEILDEKTLLFTGTIITKSEALTDDAVCTWPAAGYYMDLVNNEYFRTRPGVKPCSNNKKNDYISIFINKK